jgi:hypothetical protein
MLWLLLLSGSSTKEEVEAANGVGRSRWGQLLVRSQGYVWLAGSTRTEHCCEWSLAGKVLTLTTAGPWYCVLPR